MITNVKLTIIIEDILPRFLMQHNQHVSLMPIDADFSIVRFMIAVHIKPRLRLGSAILVVDRHSLIGVTQAQ